MNNIELPDFEKSDAAQELLGRAGITDAYEVLVQRCSLEILRQSVPDCETADNRHRLTAVFIFDCSELDREPKRVFHLDVLRQEEMTG